MTTGEAYVADDGSITPIFNMLSISLSKVSLMACGREYAFPRIGSDVVRWIRCSLSEVMLGITSLTDATKKGSPHEIPWNDAREKSLKIKMSLNSLKSFLTSNC